MSAADPNDTRPSRRAEHIAAIRAMRGIRPFVYGFRTALTGMAICGAAGLGATQLDFPKTAVIAVFVPGFAIGMIGVLTNLVGVLLLQPQLLRYSDDPFLQGYVLLHEIFHITLHRRPRLASRDP